MPKFEFSWKKGLCQFLNIPIIYHHVKRSEKTNEPLLKKMPNWQTDRQTDRQTNRQQWLDLLEEEGPDKQENR